MPNNNRLCRIFPDSECGSITEVKDIDFDYKCIQ
ncbi:hypothetical protein LCGC14_2250790, partial [marine sediment metagenome]